MGKSIHFFISLVLGLLFMLGGCAPDSRELDNRSMILGMAIDKEEDKDEYYSVSIQLPKFGGGATGPRASEFEVFTARGERLWDAIIELESHTPTVLFFGHLKVVAISEKVAKEGLRPVIDYLDRDPIISNQIQLLIIKDEEAKEFISKESPLVSLPALYLDRFFTAEQKLTRSQPIKLFEYRRDTNGVAKSAILPLATTKEKKIIIKDMAIFKEHKMVGELSGTEVGITTLIKKGALSQKNKSTTVKMEDDTEVKVALRRIELTRKISYQKQKPLEVEIKIKGKGEIAEIGEGRTSAEFMKKVEEQLKEDIKKDTLETLSKLQKLNVEPLLLSQRVWALNPRYFESLDWEKDGWKETKFKISVDFKIDNTGQRGLYNKEILD